MAERERLTGVEILTLTMAALTFAVPALVGGIVGYFLKSSNPDGVDVTAGLAYLQPILIAAGIALVVWLALTVWAIWLLRKVAGGRCVPAAITIMVVSFTVGLIVNLIQNASNNLS